MKRAILTLCLIVTTLISTAAVRTHQVTIQGRVVGDSGDPISYATVVLSLSDRQIAGMATDEQGNFSLTVESGEYELSISYIGYQSYSVRVEGECNLGDITLEAEAEDIEQVVVTSNFIRREADRFVVDVANAPSSIGQDGEELLKSSPGVWIMNDEISINGNSNPKIFVNDRELKISSEQIMIYLRNLKSDDVSRIEVIPQSGADFDASGASGAIMIYLRRQLNSGMVGNIGIHSRHNSDLFSLSPSASVNFQSEKLTLNTSAWYSKNDYSSSIESSANYYDLEATLAESSLAEVLSSSMGGRIEAIYAIDGRHSVGGEVRYYENENPLLSTTNSSMSVSGVDLTSNSLFDSESSSENISATFNYIYKLDTLGSSLKLLADYNKNSSSGFSDNISSSYGVDSLYQSNSISDFKVATITMALEKIVTPKLSLKAGAKYTHNDMDSRSSYNYLQGSQWVDLESYNSDELYTEDISAAYIIGTSRFGKWSVVAGVRGEYTQTKGRDNLLDKDYLSLFPNLNVSYLLDPTGANSLTLQYSRSINRPNFWSLNPTRRQASEYLYSIGNPSLMPEYKNSINVTYVHKYKYSLTASMQISENSIVQIMTQDENNPDVICISSENITTQESYFLSANLPFQIAPWWSLNANITYGYRGETIYEQSETQYQHMLFANGQSSFTLPKEFYINLSYFGMSGVYSGNIYVAPRNYSSVSLSKKFFDKRLNASITANNLFPQDEKIVNTTTSVEQTMVTLGGWNRPSIGFSLSYNFKAGKEYQRRQGVESASAEDKARLSNSSEGGDSGVK